MTRIPIEQPVETPEPAPMGGSKITHPAFATIQAHRVSGTTSLFQSDFLHHHYVSVSISHAEKNRHLSNDWVYGRKTIIEINMSEAQWAAFVSSVNCGSGTPCTLSRHNGESVPRLPDPTPAEERFKAEVGGAAKEAINGLDVLHDAIEAAGLSKKRTDELLGKLRMARSKLECTMPFIANQFSEHCETTVEKAKTEINAYAVGTLTRMGLEKAIGLSSPIEQPKIAEVKNDA